MTSLSRYHLKIKIAQAKLSSSQVPIAVIEVPANDYSQTDIVLLGIGLETARRLTELNANKVILACRSIERGEQAKKDIEETTEKHNVVEVWQLDLASYDSVKEFAARVRGLERVDALINNAGLLTFNREMVEGHESALTVNVISMALLTLLVLPALRQTMVRFNIVPRITIVSSDASFDVSFLHMLSESRLTKSGSSSYNRGKHLRGS